MTLHSQGNEENDSAEVLAVLDDDQKPLGYYSVQDWQVLKVCFFSLDDLKIRRAGDIITGWVFQFLIAGLNR